MRPKNLRAGDWVQVKDKDEILSTLDENGCVEGLPFMPEMLAFCGRRMRVYKRAHKTCDTIHASGGRRMVETVHLEDARCDGQAHGGCQADCLIFWKEAWLKKATRIDKDRPPRVSPPDEAAAGNRGCDERKLSACTRKTGGTAPDGVVAYVCQATQLIEASTPLPWWNLQQYWEDFASGNQGLRRMVGVFFYAAYTKAMERGGRIGLPEFLLGLYNRWRSVRGLPRHPRTKGRIPAGSRTPTASLNLQPGELVRVKNFEDILNTIDANYFNRGMKWDAEMVPYCGGVYRVRARVQQLIEEKTGKMTQLKSPAIILEGVVCQSRYSNCRYFCPRAIYPYWREIWLERVGEAH